MVLSSLFALEKSCSRSRSQALNMKDLLGPKFILSSEAKISDFIRLCNTKVKTD